LEGGDRRPPRDKSLQMPHGRRTEPASRNEGHPERGFGRGRGMIFRSPGASLAFSAALGNDILE